MSAKKALLIDTSSEPDWENSIRSLDEFKADQGIHVEITGRDILSYSRLSDLVKEIINRGLKPIARVTINVHNYKDLPEVVSLLKNKGVPQIYFSQVDISALSPENHGLLVPAREMLPYLVKAVEAARKEGLEYRLENLPLCLLPGEEDHFILGAAPGIKMQFCLNCELNPRCGGITKAHLIAEYGTQLVSWQFLFPKNFFTEQDIAFLDDQLLKSADKG